MDFEDFFPGILIAVGILITLVCFLIPYGLQEYVETQEQQHIEGMERIESLEQTVNELQEKLNIQLESR